jgi:hypothetical protein
MADYALYWKNFVKDQRGGPGLDLRRYTSDESLFKKLKIGDRLWLYTSGAACGEAHRYLGYLVQIATVQAMRRNSGDSPDYPSSEFRFVIECDPQRSQFLDRPLLIDAVLFPDLEENRDLPVGIRHQRTASISDDRLAGVLDHLRRERGELHRTVTERWAASAPEGPATRMS